MVGVDGVGGCGLPCLNAIPGVAGETKNMRDVKSLVKSLNVQLDNLCQVNIRI